MSSAFSTYVMSIVGCICLTILIDLLLQDGETKKYVKGISSLIIFSVILAPLPQFISSSEVLSNEYSIDKNDMITYQNQDFLYQIKQKECEKNIITAKELLKKDGVFGVDIEVVLSYGTEINILKIIADKKNAVITKNDENIDIVEVIKSCISSCFFVEENLIEVIN